MEGYIVGGMWCFRGERGGLNSTLWREKTVLKARVELWVRIHELEPFMTFFARERRVKEEVMTKS